MAQIQRIQQMNHKMRNDVTAGYIVSDISQLRNPAQKIADFLERACKADNSSVIFLENCSQKMFENVNKLLRVFF